VLQQLHAKSNGLRAAGAQTIGEVLKTNKTLTLLDLSNNEIGAEKDEYGKLTKATPEGPAALADGLKANLSVQQLHVFGNALGQAGGEAFAEALKSNSTLDSIVIGSKDKSATVPLKELRDNSIDALDYQGKELLVEGGIVLASALKSNSSVTKVGQRVFDVFILFYFL
jgi:hypothetical protein